MPCVKSPKAKEQVVVAVTDPLSVTNTETLHEAHTDSDVCLGLYDCGILLLAA